MEQPTQTLTAPAIPTLTPAPAQAPAPVDPMTLPPVQAGLMDSHGFVLAQRIATMLSKSTLVPPTYQGQAGLSNCIIALNMAQRMGADPLMVIQNLYVVYGRPGWSSQFLIATFNRSGRFSALRYEFVGHPGNDAWGCFAYSTELSTGEVLQGTTVTMSLAKAEGWYGKKDSKWVTMPEQMLRYRAAGWFIRAYAPEIAMGLQTADEVHDTYDASKDAHGTYGVQGSVDLNELVAQTPAPVAPPAIEVKAEPVLAPEPPKVEEPAKADFEKAMDEMPDPAPTPDPIDWNEAPFDVEPPADILTPDSPPKAKRTSQAELADLREELAAEIAAKKVDLRIVEKAVGEFKNRWAQKDMDRIRNFILPNLAGERRQ